MYARMNQIVVDCRDPQRLVRFWAALLGGDPVDRARGWSHVEPPGGVRLAFQPVAEDKAAKNRLHLDVAVEAIEPAAARALALGATRIGPPVTDDQGSFQVMADPEGNEFCLVTQT
ncbi:VOC family protein [Actinomadura sp. ATCC 31491]|uniref:VOC family protein n=1 Tax=Actinomadura luzonensis TaxID=2805427 RepID=A0ABT0FN35_9ACTN|nr:VOC family protein [Actinomadura luzonensis]MCK2213755.1 VOC family protein [Actinomadura luzonensis]